MKTNQNEINKIYQVFKKIDDEITYTERNKDHSITFVSPYLKEKINQVYQTSPVYQNDFEYNTGFLGRLNKKLNTSPAWVSKNWIFRFFGIKNLGEAISFLLQVFAAVATLLILFYPKRFIKIRDSEYIPSDPNEILKKYKRKFSFNDLEPEEAEYVELKNYLPGPKKVEENIVPKTKENDFLYKTFVKIQNRNRKIVDEILLFIKKYRMVISPKTKLYIDYITSILMLK